jgi:hypothetical protein
VPIGVAGLTFVGLLLLLSLSSNQVMQGFQAGPKKQKNWWQKQTLKNQGHSRDVRFYR